MRIDAKGMKGAIAKAKELAEEIYESIISMADLRYLEKDFVLQEVTKELKVIARENGIL